MQCQMYLIVLCFYFFVDFNEVLETFDESIKLHFRVHMNAILFKV